MLTGLFTSIGIGLLLWMLYRGVKSNPEAFSRKNLSQSFRTLGLLALLLIGAVALAVLILRHS